jgi:hypothetical protein
VAKACRRLGLVYGEAQAGSKIRWWVVSQSGVRDVSLPRGCFDLCGEAATSMAAAVAAWRSVRGRYFRNDA